MMVVCVCKGVQEELPRAGRQTAQHGPKDQLVKYESVMMTGKTGWDLQSVLVY